MNYWTDLTFYFLGLRFVVKYWPGDSGSYWEPLSPSEIEIIRVSFLFVPIAWALPEVFYDWLYENENFYCAACEAYEIRETKLYMGRVLER